MGATGPLDSFFCALVFQRRPNRSPPLEIFLLSGKRRLESWKSGKIPFSVLVSVLFKRQNQGQERRRRSATLFSGLLPLNRCSPSARRSWKPPPPSGLLPAESQTPPAPSQQGSPEGSPIPWSWSLHGIRRKTAQPRSQLAAEKEAICPEIPATASVLP